MRLVGISLFACVAAALLTFAPAAAAGAQSGSQAGTLTLANDLDRVPGIAVDVSVDGLCALVAVPPGTVAKKLTLPAGAHDVMVSVSDGNCGGPLLTTLPAVTIEAGVGVSVTVADDGSGPAASVDIPTDLSPMAECQARLDLRIVGGDEMYWVDLHRDGRGDESSTIDLGEIPLRGRVVEEMVAGRYQIDITSQSSGRTMVVDIELVAGRVYTLTFNANAAQQLAIRTQPAEVSEVAA